MGSFSSECCSHHKPCCEETDKTEMTLSLIKPDAVKENLIGKIIDRFESNGLEIIALKLVQLSPDEGAAFYAVHEGKPFFDELVDYISSGPIVAMILAGDNAVKKNREIMGATDPQKATPGTLRKDFGKSISSNVVHGSDAPETAAEEIAFFFSSLEIH